jgi:hypothetical protein
MSGCQMGMDNSGMMKRKLAVEKGMTQNCSSEITDISANLESLVRDFPYRDVNPDQAFDVVRVTSDAKYYFSPKNTQWKLRTYPSGVLKQNEILLTDETGIDVSIRIVLIDDVHQSLGMIFGCGFSLQHIVRVDNTRIKDTKWMLRIASLQLADTWNEINEVRYCYSNESPIRKGLYVQITLHFPEKTPINNIRKCLCRRYPQYLSVYRAVERIESKGSDLHRAQNE